MLRFVVRFLVTYKEFFDILGTSISQSTLKERLLTVVSFPKYSFRKNLQYIFRAGDGSLRKAKMLSVLNGNLIVLEWENVHVILNIKSKRYKRLDKIYCNIQQNLAKQFTLHSAEAHSEPHQTSKIELFSEKD